MSRAPWFADASAVLGPMVDDADVDRYRVDAWPLAVKRIRAGSPGALPAAVARPQSTEDVARAVAWASSHGVSVVPWGAGSSVTGAAIPSDGALVLDLQGLDGVVEIDGESGRVRVQAGMLGSALEQSLQTHGLTTWFSPQSLHRSTVGGWVATGATGQFSSRWGGIEDAVLALTVVLADGTVVDVGTPPRGAVGPDLTKLFVGSEGAFGVITEVVLRTHPLSTLSGLSAFSLPSVDAGLLVLRTVMQADLRPALLRLYDADEAEHLAVPRPVAPATLLVAFAGCPAVAEAEQRVVETIVEEAGGESLGPTPTEKWLESRYDFSRVERLLESSGGYAETIEVAVGWREMSATYRALKSALGLLADEVLCHFSHTYTDGTSLYVIVLGRAVDDLAAVSQLERIWSTAMRTALDQGAVISHHHGVGRARAPFLGDQLGQAQGVLATLKRALDPQSILHPGSLRPA